MCSYTVCCCFSLFTITRSPQLCVVIPSLSAIQFSDANSICRYLARVAPALGLYGANMMEQTEVCVRVRGRRFCVTTWGSFSSFEMLSAVCRSTTGWSSVPSVCVASLVCLWHWVNWIRPFPCGPSWLDMPSPWLTFLSGPPSKVSTIQGVAIWNSAIVSVCISLLSVCLCFSVQSL